MHRLQSFALLVSFKIQLHHVFLGLVTVRRHPTVRGIIKTENNQIIFLNKN